MGSSFCAHRAERRCGQSQVPRLVEARQRGHCPAGGEGRRDAHVNTQIPTRARPPPTALCGETMRPVLQPAERRRPQQAAQGQPRADRSATASVLASPRMAEPGRLLLPRPPPPGGSWTLAGSPTCPPCPSPWSARVPSHGSLSRKVTW